MGKLSLFEISFSNTSGVFCADTAVEGHVTVELNEPMKMRGIRIQFHGRCFVHFTEKHVGARSDHDRDEFQKGYVEDEKYFDQDVLLFGIWPGQGSTTTELPSGRHTFPFRYMMPQGLPSSFEGKFGHIRYQALCHIDRPWKFDIKTKRLFTIYSLLDLNWLPQYSRPLMHNKGKHLGCCGCTPGIITAQFSIERLGWVPGEVIKLYADISNGTDKRMKRSYVYLKQTIVYHAKKRKQYEFKRVATVSHPAIEAFGEDTWTSEEMEIPPLPPSYLTGYGIIDVEYNIQLNVDPPGVSSDLEITLPIIIGTIPLMSVVNEAPPTNPEYPPH